MQSPESGPKLAAVGFEIHGLSQFITKVSNPCGFKVQIRSTAFTPLWMIGCENGGFGSRHWSNTGARLLGTVMEGYMYWRRLRSAVSLSVSLSSSSCASHASRPPRHCLAPHTITLKRLLQRQQTMSTLLRSRMAKESSK